MNIKTTLFAALLAGSAALAQAQLNVSVYQGNADSFNVTSTLITGEKDAILIDSGFTRADALRIAANILDSQKNLKTILISQADPDYYFGVETLKQIFPEAKVVATPAVLHEIEKKMPRKVAFWSPKMGNNAPKTPVLPEQLSQNTLHLDGETIEIKGTTGVLASRPYVWIPSLKTITGNVGIFSNMHAWTADSQSKAERQAWLKQLDEMKALKPSLVIAGHANGEAKQNAQVINFVKNYLTTFEQAVASSQNSTQVIEKMEKAYPNLASKNNLELGAKVVKGEMKW